ncbi:hypothetical protein DICVIV_10838 [Dictyocaulus viviparus]|uniref:Uncharacterized protein n=1 Tax=Dictyocaulus viviparus TaxID=29172 RepID=A0A0D8XHC3_DICVI|nr:hypothetical protein DICVIV_10838 [Dictyocaulus viviparus]
MSTTSLACWMAKLPSDMAARPLCLLKIPGLPFSSLALRTEYTRSITAGCRVFSKEYKGDVYVALLLHLYSHFYDIGRVFVIIYYLLQVVFLDMNHLFNMDELTYRKLQNETTTILGRNQICPFMNSNMVSLDFMWSNGYRHDNLFFFAMKFLKYFPLQIPSTFCHCFRVIVFTSFIETNPTIFWPATTICSPWPNTNKINNLLDILSFNLEHRQDDTFKFFVTQGVCTPRVSDVDYGIGHSDDTIYKDH